MISMLAVALTMSNPAASMPQVERPGSIRGFVGARVDGFKLGCRGVLLIPRMKAVDEQIQHYFGTPDNGIRPVSYGELQRTKSGSDKPPPGAREVDCRFFGYRFKNVPPGPYYIVATVALDPRPSYNDPAVPLSGQALNLMRRVDIQPGATVKVDLTNN